MNDAFWEFTAALVLVGGLLIAVVPARWVGWTVVAWIVSPVPIYVAYAFWEAASHPGTNVLGNAMLGFALISAFVLIPWLIVAGITVAIGLVLRGVFRTKPVIVEKGAD